MVVNQNSVNNLKFIKISIVISILVPYLFGQFQFNPLKGGYGWILLPCMWPKNPPLLELKVLVDILLIVLLRVTYVFVPIYHKNIVNCLTTLSLD